MSSGITLSSRPWMIRVSCRIARILSSGVAMASTQRWRGAGNMAENASWTPGASAAQVPDLGELVVHELTAVGEIVEDPAHVRPELG